MEDKRLVVIQRHIWYAWGCNSDEEPNIDTKVVAIIDNEKEGEKYLKGWKRNKNNYEVGNNDDHYERFITKVGYEW